MMSNWTGTMLARRVWTGRSPPVGWHEARFRPLFKWRAHHRLQA